MTTRSLQIDDATRPVRVLRALLGVTLGTAVVVASTGSAWADPMDKVGPDVLERLRTTGKAHVVVAYRDTVTRAATVLPLPELRKRVAGTTARVLSAVAPGDYRVRLSYRTVPASAGTLLTEHGLLALAQHSDVERIDLDVGGTGGLASTVPLIGADQRQALGNDGAGVVVAVLDTGMDTDHDDLSQQLIHEECFNDADGLIDGVGNCPNGSDRQSGPGAAEDDAGHGTHVTGIVASKGIRSAKGVAPAVDIVSIRVSYGPSFSGSFAFFSEVVAGLDFIIDNPQFEVKVLNMSLVTFATFAGNCDNSASWLLAGAAAINTLRANGVVSFASSGNTGLSTSMTAPACLSNVIAVAASTNGDQMAVFSSTSSTTDIVAPGVSVVSDAIGNGTIAASGTSMASPHAAGCAALLIQSGEAVTPEAIETRLEDSRVEVRDASNRFFPRIDCAPNPVCGDMIVESSETCDPPDPSSQEPDRCRDDCTFCGDGIVDSEGGLEQCDDGNNVDGDGCQADCRVSGVGGIPATGPAGLQLDKLGTGVGDAVALSWSASCSPADEDYAVYEGVLGFPTSVNPMVCSTGGSLLHDVTPFSYNTFFLVVPQQSLGEGSYGTNSAAVERQTSQIPCAPLQSLDVCVP